MKNQKTTKRALLSSVLSLFLCVAMLVGTTFAWFTDSVTSANNIIKSGNLDVELYYQAEGETAWTKVDANTNVFKADTLWEPGHTEVVKLKVVNEGSLALKYQLGVNVADETPSVNVNGDPFKLSDFIKYGIVEGAQNYTRDAAIAAVDADATALNVAYNSGTTNLASEAENIVTMVVYMPTEVGNEANAAKDAAVPTIWLGINLFATQTEAEEDSFGSDYDKDAWHEKFEVATAGDLQAALTNAEAGDVVTLTDDIELTESIVIPAAATTYSMRRAAPAAVTIDLNGKTITIDAAYDNAAATASSAIVNNGNLILTGDGAVKATNNYTIRNYGTMVIDGITVENGIMNFADLTVESGNISNSRSGKHTIYGNAATLTINGGTFYNGNPGNAAIFAYAGKVTLNGGEFSIADGTATLGWTSCLVDAQGNATYTVNGGVYYGEFRDYNNNTAINGGNFSINPSKFVADGFKAVADASGMYTVINAEYTAAYNEATLRAALAASGKVLVLNDIAVNANDTITIAAGVDVALDLNGYKISATADKSGNQELFLVKGNMTVKNGALEFVAKNNQAWSAMATIFDITAGGVLNMDDVDATVSGTDMAFCAHLNNWGAATLNATDSTFTSNYVAIRVFNSGYDMNNVTLTNCALFGASSNAFWVHNYTEADFGASYDEAAVNNRLNFNFTNTTFKTNGTKGVLRFGMTNAIYYSDVTMTEVVAGNEAALKWALAHGKNVILSGDIAMDATMSNGYGATGIVIDGQTLNGNGYSLKVTKAGGTWDSAIFIKSGTVKNITVKNSFRGIFMSDAATGDVYLDAVKFEGVVYTVNSDGKSTVREGALYVSNCEINGWTSFSDTHTEVIFTNCSFGEGSGNAFARPYNVTSFVNCSFDAGFAVDARAAITFENCTLDGAALTADNLATLVTSNIANASVK